VWPTKVEWKKPQENSKHSNIGGAKVKKDKDD